MDDAELMEMMDQCEPSGDDQHEQRDSTTPSHFHRSEPEQTGTLHKIPPQSESSQEWNKPTIQETERESVHSTTRHEGEEKSERGEKDEGEQERRNEKGSGMEEESEGSVWAQRVCQTHERAVPMQDTVDELDITEEGEEVTMI